MTLLLPTDEHSYWLDKLSRSTFPSLHVNLKVDVVIVGGGITGLTTAYLLKKSGLNVVVLEKNTIASGATGGTTGKVTSQHNLIYDDLYNRLGKKTAQIYAEANQTALDRIEQIIKTEKIDCGWERDDNYVYTTNLKQVAQFKSEAKIAAKLGLPASFETVLPLPFKTVAAVKFANQAKMHAPKYVLALASAVHGQGSYVFENSNVIHFSDGQLTTVKTKDSTITAKDIVVATKVPAFPLIDRFTCAFQEYPHTSYLVAGPLDSKLKGMYISPDKNHYSLLPVTDGQKQLLLIGGQKHIPGLGNAVKRQQKLANYAEEYFGIKTIDYRWKAMDYLVYDSVPLIGKVYPWSKHIYVATGFMKWGLSTSMVAGTILHDTILGQENPWASVFDSLRLKPILSMHRAIKQLR